MARAILSGRLVGAETVVTDIRRHGDTIRARLKAEVEAQGRALQSRAAAMAPRKTGRLASSITSVGKETDTQLQAVVGTDLMYGRFLESGFTPNPRKKAGWRRNPRKAVEWRAYARRHGGRRIVARPFLKPAVAAMRATIRGRLLATIRGEA